MSLFQKGNFTLNSGVKSDWKLELDSLTDGDWETLAFLASKCLPPFSSVEGVPTGGLKFAEALKTYTAGTGTLLICDDVLTSGGSLERHRDGRQAAGIVVFARGVCPIWVHPLFMTSTWLR